jgi:hypothetical protein
MSGVLLHALPSRVERGAQEAGHGKARDRGRVLEGEEHAQASALVGRERQDVAVLPDHLALPDDVGGVAHQSVGERRLARPVGAHDRVDLALADHQVDPLQDLRVGRGHGCNVEVADLEVLVAHGGAWLLRGSARRCAGKVRRRRGFGRRGRARPGVGTGISWASVVVSRTPLMASRTITQRWFTEQAPRRSHSTWLGSSDAQIIGASGPSSARSASPSVISRGIARQRVATPGAARRGDDPGLPERDGELLEVGPRQRLVDRDLRQRDRHGRVRPPATGKLDEHPHAVLALRAEGDGA